MQLSAFRRYVTCVCLLTLALGARAESIYATPYYFSTYAGWPEAGSADGSAATAQFATPVIGAVDRAGNLYVSDQVNRTIRKISPSGEVITFAGSPLHPGSKDGVGQDAQFSFPRGLALDQNENVYVADAGNHTIRKITPAGVVTTFAGATGIGGATDGPRDVARFDSPADITIDPSGIIFVADAGNGVIRIISSAGNVSTLRGSGFPPSDSYNCDLIRSDGSGNLYASNSGGIVTKIPVSGAASVIFHTLNDQVPPLRNFSYNGMTVDTAGNVYLNYGRESDPNRNIVKVRAIDTVDAIASIEPKANGLSLDSLGNFYYADRNTIQRTRASSAPARIAGTVGGAGNADGLGTSARFAIPYGIVADKAGNVYVAEWSGNQIRKIAADGQVTTFAGGTVYANPGQVPVDGTGKDAQFDHPTGLTADDAGNVYVADNRRIRKITPNAVVTTVAGGGTAGSTGLDTPLEDSRCIAIDGAGNLYVTESNRVRKITPAGTVITLAGSAAERGSADGTGDNARFSIPVGIVVDKAGTVFVADQGNRTIRKITSAGVVTTLAGSAGIVGSDDGTGGTARFHAPSGLSIDSDGNLFVSDDCTVRKITPSGVVTTVAGAPGRDATRDGVGELASFGQPYDNIQGLAVDKSGKIFVADGDTIRAGQLAGTPIISTQPKSQTIAPGDSVQFSVAAAGIPAPTYQWYFNNTPYSAATGSTLSFSNARSSDAGDYSVVVTNSLGNVTSAKATLTISASSQPPPSNTNGNSSSSGGGSMGSLFTTLIFLAGTLRTRFGQKTSA